MDVPAFLEEEAVPTAPTTDQLCALAETVERSLDDFDGPHAFVKVCATDEADVAEFGIKRLEPGEHPVDVLLGFVAPEEWSVFGTITFGWAAPLDGLRPSKHPKRSRVRAVQLIARDGTEAAVMRATDSEAVPLSSGMGPIAQGNVPDCIRRSLGLPTAPPETPTSHLRAMRWLVAIAARNHPSFDGCRVGWKDASALLGDIPDRSWSDERWAAVSSADGFGGEISATEAAWMDDGMFSRWVRVCVGEPYEIASLAQSACSPLGWRNVKAEIESWGIALRRVRAMS